MACSGGGISVKGDCIHERIKTDGGKECNGFEAGRGEWIRTTDLMVPKQALEKAEAACLLSKNDYTFTPHRIQLSSFLCENIFLRVMSSTRVVLNSVLSFHPVHFPLIAQATF